MSGKIIDMSTRRNGTDNADAENREKVHAKRLSEAPAIADLLRNTPRLEPSTRAIFARNLHRMIEEMSPRASSSSLRRVFEIAFGRDFDSKYKKRKRFVCAIEEEAPVEGFAAHGADYVSLAEAVADFAHDGQPANAIDQARKRAILQLIIGSEYEEQRAPEARLKDEAVASLLGCFDWMVRKVEAEVDLDAMRSVVEHEAVSAVIGSNGEVESLRGARTWDDLFPQRLPFEGDEVYEAREREWFRANWHPAKRALFDTFPGYGNPRTKAEWQTFNAALHLGLSGGPNEEPVRIFDSELFDWGSGADERSSPFAPRVVLGEVYSPEEVAGFVMVEIDEDEIERELQQNAQDYDEAINRHALSEIAPEFDRDREYRTILEKAAAKALAAQFGYPDAWISKECGALSDLEDKIQEDQYQPPNDPWNKEVDTNIVARRQIELKLLCDYTTRRWRLCLALSQGIRVEHYMDREGVFGEKHYNQPFEHSINLGVPDVAPSLSIAANVFLHRSAPNRFMIYAVENYDLPRGYVFGIGIGWESIPSQPALDAMFTPIEDNKIEAHDIVAPLDRYWNKPAPAKIGTLAGMILRNLAYAPDEERYDRLLLQDAKRKAEMVRDFAAERRKEFDAAIKRVRE